MSDRSLTQLIFRNLILLAPQNCSIILTADGFAVLGCRHVRVDDIGCRPDMLGERSRAMLVHEGKPVRIGQPDHNYVVNCLDLIIATAHTDVAKPGRLAL